MAKVFGIHKLALKPGVKGEDFEEFFRTSGPKDPLATDWKVHLLRGDKGDREGKYLLLFEIDSVEARDRDAEGAAEDQSETPDEFFEKWLTFCTSVTDPTFTDYVVVSD